VDENGAGSSGDVNPQDVESMLIRSLMSSDYALHILYRQIRQIVMTIPGEDHARLAEDAFTLLTVSLTSTISQGVDISRYVPFRQVWQVKSVPAPATGGITMPAVTGVSAETQPEQARKTGLAHVGLGSLTVWQLLALALLWVIALGFPFAQEAMPASVRGVSNSEVGTVGLALAVTATIIAKHRK
jgi:hypothetical protein